MEPIAMHLQAALDRRGFSARQAHRAVVELLRAQGTAEKDIPSPATAARWFTGESDPRATHLIALADVLGVSLDVLTGRDPVAGLSEDEKEVLRLAKRLTYQVALDRLMLAPNVSVKAGGIEAVSRSGRQRTAEG